jgi:hypothetical protein
MLNNIIELMSSNSPNLLNYLNDKAIHISTIIFFSHPCNNKV